MKALRTIGIIKALRFLWFSFLTAILHWCVVPQLRVFLLRAAGANIGIDTIIQDATFFNLYHYGFRNLTVGKRCFIGDEVVVDLRGKVVLEDDVTLSCRSIILTHINVGYRDHPLQKYFPTKEEVVIFKSGCYVAAGAIILPGVIIGSKSVIAAGAVVTKNVSSKSLVAGVPAKIIKRLI